MSEGIGGPPRSLLFRLSHSRFSASVRPLSPSLLHGMEPSQLLLISSDETDERAVTLLVVNISYLSFL